MLRFPPLNLVLVVSIEAVCSFFENKLSNGTYVHPDAGVAHLPAVVPYPEKQRQSPPHSAGCSRDPIGSQSGGLPVVGERVGATVGGRVGAAVGGRVGGRVGTAVGATVGAAVL
eukprot:TRINITY_DN349_c0_g1_i2.p1 TRINITY_DN349_c0_g1~~TRINITY_DN349_c0_g1_i2.p1  ORF type:complete len:114 (+),score=30.11 TRINITY_DN349_c0_g1_i2:102-443(+)